MVAIGKNAPIPISDPIARTKRAEFKADKRFNLPERDDPLEGLLTDPWAEYFNQLILTVEAATFNVRVVSLTDQSASISATDMTDGTLSSGLYQLQYYVRVTQAATTSSSIAVTLSWTDGGISLEYVSSFLIGNTTDTYESATQLIRSDAISPIQYLTNYASVGATPMKYALYVTLTEVQA